MKLHIGGKEVKQGWKLLNIQSGPGVDYVADLSDLSQFPAESVGEVYASHVLEHIPQEKVPATLSGVQRILIKGGLFKVAVPDLEALCRLMLEASAPYEVKFHVMRMMFGGQLDAHDFHYFGWTLEFMTRYLADAGFSQLRRVDSFGLFDDTSEFRPYGVSVSLNVIATK